MLIFRPLPMIYRQEADAPGSAPAADPNPAIVREPESPVRDSPNPAETPGQGETQDPAAPPAADPGAAPEPRPANTRWRDKFFELEQESRRDRALLRQYAEQGLRPNGQAQPANVPKHVAEKREPREEDFPGDFNAYLRAAIDYGAEQKLRDVQRQAREGNWQQQEQQERAAFQTKLEKGYEEFPDFEAVALSDKVPCTPAMFEGIRASEIPARVMHYLGSNPAEAERISKLPPTRQVIEIGKVEDKILKLPARKTTEAPDPAQTLNGGAKPSKGAYTLGLSFKDYEAVRLKEIEAAEKRR